MKNISKLLIASIWLMSVTVTAQNKVDQLTKQWLDLDKSNYQLTQGWQHEQQQLTLRISLLKQQNKNFETQIEQAKDNHDQVSEQRLTLLKSQSVAESAVNQYRLALPNLTNQMQQLMATLPPYLVLQLTPELSQVILAADLNTQYQSLSKMTKQITKAGQLMMVKQGVISLAGTELLTQQLYFGNDQAWFITQDNSRSGIGYSQDGRWKWQEQPDIATEVRQAISNAKNQIPGPLFSLPVNLGANHDQ